MPSLPVLSRCFSTVSVREGEEPCCLLEGNSLCIPMVAVPPPTGEHVLSWQTILIIMSYEKLFYSSCHMKNYFNPHVEKLF